MDLPSIVANNPNLAYQLFLALLMAANAQSQGPYPYLDVLTKLPPTLPSFDLLVRLLQDTSIVIDPATGGKTTVADIVRIETLGRFIHESIEWLDNAEREEREGLISDDRFAKGVQNVSSHHAVWFASVHSRYVMCVALSLLYLSVEALDRGCGRGRGHCRDGTFHAAQLAVRGSEHAVPIFGCRMALRNAHGAGVMLGVRHGSFTEMRLIL